MLRLRDGSSLTARLRRFPGGKAGAGKKGFELREVCAIIIVEKNPDALNAAARLVWERVAPPSSRKIPCPQSLDMPAIQALPPQAEMVKKTA